MEESYLKPKGLSFLKALGEGSFGQVIKVRSYAKGQVSAVKCISIGNYRIKASNNDIFKIIREVNVIQKLNGNKHVVRIIDSWIHGPMQQYFSEMFQIPNASRGDTEDTETGSSGIGVTDAEKNTFVLIQMEYCETDLQKWMKVNATRSIDIVLKFSCEMLDGLAYIHKNNVVHRDLKPANILISQLDHSICCKIGDFGLARFKPENKNDLYTTGIGTFQYMSPEMLREKQIDYKTDIFSMGLILLELVYCSASKNVKSDLCDIQNGRFPEYFNNQENEDFYKVVREMLSQNAADRPAAAACLTKLITLVYPNLLPLVVEFQQTFPDLLDVSLQFADDPILKRIVETKQKHSPQEEQEKNISEVLTDEQEKYDSHAKDVFFKQCVTAFTNSVLQSETSVDCLLNNVNQKAEFALTRDNPVFIQARLVFTEAFEIILVYQNKMDQALKEHVYFDPESQLVKLSNGIKGSLLNTIENFPKEFYRPLEQKLEQAERCYLALNLEIKENEQISAVYTQRNIEEFYRTTFSTSKCAPTLLDRFYERFIDIRSRIKTTFDI